MAYSQMTTAETDADSPLNEPLFTKIKNNFDAIVDSGTSKIATGMVTQASAAAACIGQGELKTSTEEQSVLIGGATGVGTVTFSSIATYGLIPQTKVNTTNTHDVWFTRTTSVTTYGTQCRITSLSGTTNVTHYVQMRYVTASPPHALDGIPVWPKFLYLLRHKTSGLILRSSFSDDPPGYHSAVERGIPKGHAAMWLECWTPFGIVEESEAQAVGGTLADFETVLVDLRARGLEPIEMDRRQLCLDKLQAMRPEWVKKGIPEKYLLEREAEVQAKINRTPPTSKDLICGCALDLHLLEGRMAGSWDLETALKLPEVATATRDVADTEDGKFLRTVPGLFVPDLDGTPPKIRVVQAP